MAQMSRREGSIACGATKMAISVPYYVTVLVYDSGDLVLQCSTDPRQSLIVDRMTREGRRSGTIVFDRYIQIVLSISLGTISNSPVH
eukprot:81157-Rhodomonas_salina.1